MTDHILERYLEEYAHAQATEKESRMKVQAKILRSLVRYLKKKSGGLAAHAETLSPLIMDMEAQLCVALLHDFLYISETISLAKKFTLVQKSAYAGGFKRRPSSKDSAKASTLLQSVSIFKSEDRDSPQDGYDFS